MSIQGVQFCDLCGETIALDALAPIKIEADGHLQQFHFHNRSQDDCLARKLDELREQFEGEAVLVPSL